ncbi:MAG: PEP-utilizing enzyme [Chloroflexota bacterium]
MTGPYQRTALPKPEDSGTTPEAFPTPWEDDADPSRSWAWDDMHMPFALTPLAADYVRALGQGFNLAPQLFGGFPQRWHARVWNGYAYFAHDANTTEDTKADTEARWLAVHRERAEVTTAYWADEVLPELKGLESRLRTLPVEDLAPTQLAAGWDEAWAAVRRMWELHFCIILGPYQILEDLADLYEKAVPGASPGESLRLVQGTRNDLLDAELGIERLAEEAAARPAIRQLLAAQAGGETGGDHGSARTRPITDEIRELPGGPAFLVELDAFLARHGHLGQAFDDLALPSWAEAPDLLLTQLGMHLARPPEPAEARRARLAADAASLADGVRVRLATQPETLQQFEHLLSLARAIGPLTEGHNYWIDRLAQARIRSLVMRVGQRLKTDRCLADADDILFLTRDEIRDLILTPRGTGELVAMRRAEHATQRTLTPPREVGRASTPGTDRFDGERFTSTEPDVLRGTGASAGVVRGPARVTLGPEDFGRIRPGDIIVCPSSNPSWVPVFVVAAGLVTNTGGILSHAAVVAREFGLPAVVGTGDATSRIADGRMIEIDGATGFVRLL